MIITRTPFRISFFGGGSDFPEWYNKFGGYVLSAAINKYCYITCRILPPFFKHKYRIVYASSENARGIEEIKHPTAKAIIKIFSKNKGFEVHHDADLPARSGLGSSSAFTVGLVKAINKIYNKDFEKKDLAKLAIHIEQKIIKENIGSQDQIAATYGGLNLIEFFKNGNFKVNKLKIPNKKYEMLQENLLICYTGILRNSSDFVKTNYKNLYQKRKIIKALMSQVKQGCKILTDNTLPLDDFGLLLDETWKIKKKISSNISNNKIDTMYNIAKEAGAIGGKILGAGSGGFLLIYAKKKRHNQIKKALKSIISVPIKFDELGSQIIY